MRWQHHKNKYTLAATLRKGDIFKRHRTTNANLQTYEVLKVFISRHGLKVIVRPLNSSKLLRITFNLKTNVNILSRGLNESQNYLKKDNA